jgi:DNA-binding transcriptional LysR family regulator
MAPSDLAKHACVNFEALSPAHEWAFPSQKVSAAPVHSRLSANCADAVIDAAIAGVGIARVLNYQIADKLRNGTLVALMPDFSGPDIPVQLLRLGARQSPSKVRAFLDFAQPRLRQKLEAL